MLSSKPIGVVVIQWGRFLSTTVVRAQAQCLLSRVGVVSMHARDAAKRRVADKKERRDRRDGKSNV